MPIACQYKGLHGPQFCLTDCPVNVPCGIFLYERIDHPGSVPAPADNIIDIAVLDMNHGWPNLGHDSLVHIIREAACDLMPLLNDSGLAFRVLSYDIRKSHCLPEKPNGRFSLYLGTGGPANINPYENDGVSAGSQGIRENPAWEPQVFELFDAIYEDESAAIIGVCHTFGTMCRWSGVADPVFRGTQKGGKSSGILENLLTPQATLHPWFRHFSQRLPDQRRLRILDNRFFDLIPRASFNNGYTPIGYETLGVGGPQGEAITMLEWSRDAAGVMPRIFAVNHHPEIVDRARQLLILERLHQNGSVTEEWYQERLSVLIRNNPEDNTEEHLALTSDFTLTAPIRYYIHRATRLRAEKLRKSVSIHEDQVVDGMLEPRRSVS